MHLSSLTLRGFKSFADKTTLALEPGVTVIVGPNGSGKSNVVDALTWVLGTQSPRSLRGGAMSDVIFAGAAERAALGRAAVEITIDNADGALPLEFSEVTIGRAVFASGDTEYTINGTNCRQLDIAELLSDTGLGRQSHTIVSQGQLDAILSARPDERRAFIDEAAGISKHRKRKDRALRKLDQMQEHAARLHDLARELKRSLRPLERQAQAAARHAELSSQLRAARLARACDDLRRASRHYEQLHARNRSQRAVIQQLEERAQQLRTEQAQGEQSLAALRPTVDQAAATHFRLAATVERLRAVQTQIAERQHGLQTALDEPVMLRDPADLRKAAAAEHERLDDAQRQVGATRQRLAEAVAQREQAERALRAHHQAAAAEARRRSAAREQRLRWEGQVAALRSALAQAASEQGRLDGRLTGLRERQHRCAADVEAAERACADLTQQHQQFSEQAAQCDASVAACRAASEAALETERTCDRQRAALAARGETLAAALADVPDGARGVLEARLDGVVGRLANQVEVEPGYERAVAAVLGATTDALVAQDAAAAEQAASFARARGEGRVRLLAASSAPPPAGAELPAGVRPLSAVIAGDKAVLGGLVPLLRDTVVADDYEAACALARNHPHLVVVTRAGELAGAAGYVVGSTPPLSTVEQRAALAETRRQLAQLAADAERIHDEITATAHALTAAEQTRSAVVDQLRSTAAALTERTAQLRRLQAEAAACHRELQAVEQAAHQLDAEVALRSDQLDALEAGAVPVGDDVGEGPDLEAERLDDVVRSAREAEVDARVVLSSAGSRRDEIGRRIADIERSADQLEQAWVQADLRQQRRRRGITRCKQLAAVAQDAVTAGVAAVEASELERLAVEERRDACQRALGALRAQLDEVEHDLTDHTRAQHADELAVTNARHALEDAQRRCRDLGLDPVAVVAEDSSDLLTAQRRAELAAREEELARHVALLGPVNPLAVEEFEALQNRQRFLTEQIEDLERSRRDLLEVVAAVDQRIQEIFATAFADVADEFERLFVRLFPGGEGRLVLTDPADLLATGVDVEARPAGKRIKRLSLLSGGERSLVALAVAFAIFAARPSPFYVLDEVEAALDDINLQRVLDVMREFRSSSQLIVITHQKRTMEIADVLYGVTMRSGGVSKVVSQRLSDVA